MYTEKCLQKLHTTSRVRIVEVFMGTRKLFVRQHVKIDVFHDLIESFKKFGIRHYSTVFNI